MAARTLQKQTVDVHGNDTDFQFSYEAETQLSHNREKEKIMGRNENRYEKKKFLKN